MIGHPQVSDVVVAPIPPPAVIYPFDHVGSPCVDDVRLLAEMACSECLICSREERAAVMQVAVNRARKPGWWGRDLVSVLGKKWQFAPLHPTCSPERVAVLESEARQILIGVGSDPTRGAVYFHAKTIPLPWPEASVDEALLPGTWLHRFYRVENRKRNGGAA